MKLFLFKFLILILNWQYVKNKILIFFPQYKSEKVLITCFKLKLKYGLIILDIKVPKTITKEPN